MRTSREIEIDHSLFEKSADKLNCGASGDAIRSGKYKLPIQKIKLEGKDTFIYASGMVSHGIKSSIDAFIMTPIELYKGVTKTIFSGEFWDGADYIGLIFSSKNQQYVVSEIVAMTIDPATIDFVTSLDECREYEEEMTRQGGWRALSYERRPAKLRQNSHLVTGFFSLDKESRVDTMVVTYVRVKGKVETMCLGKAESVIQPLIEKILSKVGNGITQIIKTASQVINTPLGKEHQMNLF